MILSTNITGIHVTGDRIATAKYLRDHILRSLHLAYDTEKPIQLHGEVGDKIIVMAHTQNEDVSWVKEQLPDWQRAIYNVQLDHPEGESLTVPQNKGNEAMAYLTYIIDHYDSLPAIVLFLHAHKDGYWKAWHTDAPLHDNVLATRALHLDFVEKQGYVNLRCALHPGCINGPASGAHLTLTPQIWNEVFSNTSTPPAWMAAQAQSSQPLPKDQAARYLDHHDAKNYFVESVPKVKVACCAQFAVSRSTVLERSREDYVAFRQWLLDTDLDDHISGTAFEYLWHIIFGEMAVQYVYVHSPSFPKVL